MSFPEKPWNTFFLVKPMLASSSHLESEVGREAWRFDLSGRSVERRKPAF